MNNSHQKPQVGMIVLSSKQILPNVMGVMQSTGELKKLCIYHTANASESAEPALRLRKWMETNRPGVALEMTPPELLQSAEGDISILPQSVSGQIRKWIEANPELDWVINATGGLKLMSMGVSDFVPEEGSEIDVIYREIGGQWYRLKKVNGNLHSDAFRLLTEQGVPDLDLLTVIELHQGQKWISLKANSHALDELLKEAEEVLWNWKEVMKNRHEQEIKNTGDGLERWTAAVVKALGIKDVHCNVALHMPTQNSTKTDSKTPLEENDVLCWHNETLYLFDCKLTNQQDLEDHTGDAKTAQITEIHDVASRARALGGLRTVPILVRPTREFLAEHRMIAQSLGVKIIDGTDNHHFIDRAAEVLKVEELPDNAAKAQVWLNLAMQERRPVIALEQSDRKKEESYKEGVVQGGCFNTQRAMGRFFPDQKPGLNIAVYRNGLDMLEMCIQSESQLSLPPESLKRALHAVQAAKGTAALKLLHQTGKKNKLQWLLMAGYEDNLLLEKINNGEFHAALQEELRKTRPGRHGIPARKKDFRKHA